MKLKLKGVGNTLKKIVKSKALKKVAKGAKKACKACCEGCI